MRVLITGASGFAGRHLAALCREQGAEVTGLSRDEPDPEARELIDDHARVDLTDAGAAADGVRRARPERVFHLAAEASVARSWEDPRATIDANVTGALNLLEGVRAEAPDAAVLVAGSGETYGPVAPEHLPVSEDEPLRPQNPYAVSKAAVDLLAGFYADAYGMHVVRTRAFNHAGPGQSDAYAVASFARQIALAEADGADRLVVRTGDLAPRRDFTDVRDVVRAYWMALERARPGVLNVCSGRAVAMADILAGLASHTRLEVEQETDPARLRKHELMEIRGSHDRLTAATGWQPQVALDDTLRDALDWWRERVGAGAAR